MTTHDKLKNHNRNALIHGLYTKDVLLPWDSKDDFERLFEDLKAEFFPCGRAEVETVLDLALAYWRKRTLWRTCITTQLKDPFIDEIRQTGAKSWSAIGKRLRRKAREERGLLGTAERNLAMVLKQVTRAGRKMAASSDAGEIQALGQQLDQSLRIVSERAVPLIQMLQQGPSPEKTFEGAHAPDSLEKLQRLEALLDARISKLFGRLVALKEYKRTPAGGARTSVNAIEARLHAE